MWSIILPTLPFISYSVVPDPDGVVFRTASPSHHCPDPLQGVVFLWAGMNNMTEAVRDNPELMGTVHSLTQTF